MKTKDPILTNSLRDTLKEVMEKEINQLPDYLEKLTPIERINILLRLMPYVFPRVEAVHHKDGEPFTFD